MTEKETKLASYWNTQFTKICIGMKKKHDVNWMVIPYKANSLFKVIADGKFTATSMGRNYWKSLISGSKLQKKCNKEGFNIDGGNKTYVRIGIATGNNNDCESLNSGIGFGASIRLCDSDKVENTACGNLKVCPNHHYNLAFGYIFVQ